jgi:hypothetical protein
MKMLNLEFLFFKSKAEYTACSGMKGSNMKMSETGGVTMPSSFICGWILPAENNASM